MVTNGVNPITNHMCNSLMGPFINPLGTLVTLILHRLQRHQPQMQKLWRCLRKTGNIIAEIRQKWKILESQILQSTQIYLGMFVCLFSKRRGNHKFHASPLARYNFEKLPTKVKGSSISNFFFKSSQIQMMVPNPSPVNQCTNGPNKLRSFRTGPDHQNFLDRSGTDLPQKECDKMVQKHARI